MTLAEICGWIWIYAGFAFLLWGISLFIGKIVELSLSRKDTRKGSE